MTIDTREALRLTAAALREVAWKVGMVGTEHVRTDYDGRTYTLAEILALADAALAPETANIDAPAPTEPDRRG